MHIDLGTCESKILDIHGQRGREWIDRLPDTLATCAERWSLQILPPFTDLSYNYVTPALAASGDPVVIKAGVPSQELNREMEALRAFDGHGITRLIDADVGLGVMLLERLLPGEPLADIEDDETVTHVAAVVMRQLWTPVPADHRFATVRDWASDLDELRRFFGGGFGPFPPDLVETAQGMFAELLGPAREGTLIHGDTHPQNMLSAQREPWLAIDPKGVTGDPLYDVACFAGSLPDTLPEADQRPLLARRVDQLAEELELDRRLIARWGLAHCVLSGWWSFEDHGRGWEGAFERAKVFESLMEDSR